MNRVAAKNQRTGRSRAGPSWTHVCTVVLILVWTLFSEGGLVLSLTGNLNRTGCMVLLAGGLLIAVCGYHKLNGSGFRPGGVRIKRFLKPYPMIFLFCALASLAGGLLHAPTNHDALCYRVPRLLHWLAEGHWHWIGGADPRMDFSAAGFEAMMLPVLGSLHTTRPAFLINMACFLLLPGLIFTVFKGLGIRGRIAALWMWILPCGSCFAMSAGSIGNDLPGCALVLGSLMFATRAAHYGKSSDIVLCVFAAALMTSVKASNLPLLLPVTLGAIPALRRHSALLRSATVACVLAMPASFLPNALANYRHTGDWTGSPGSAFVMNDPLAGIAGNTLLIGSGAMAPAVFPTAEKINTLFDRIINRPPLDRIRAHFPDLRMTHPQLASEESSGLGAGVTAVLGLGLLGSWKRIRFIRLNGPGGLVVAGFWIALFFYMAKLGNCGAPRLVAPYYAGVIALPLLLLNSGSFFRKRICAIPGLLMLLPIIPALVCSPARPLLPMEAIVQHLKKRGTNSGILDRMEIVYRTYATRSDAFAPVRNLIPGNVETIGFGGSSGEPQYSFWLPMDGRRVVDLGNDPSASHQQLDVIVASDRGCLERFGIKPERLAEIRDCRIIGSVAAMNFASSSPSQWYVMVPRQNGETGK